ncbi:MAG: DNA primase [Alphaproteobacteria bacterium]
MSIHARFLDEIRNRLSLSDVIGARIQVTRAGREFKACCPFHKEKTPSFTINDDKQFYHCFGCGAHGNVIDFVMQHDNLPFPEAVELLAGQAGLQMPKPSKEDVQQAKAQKDLYTLTQEAASWFEDQLFDPRNGDMLAYVKGRGFTEETIRNFHLGFAPGDHQALRSHLSAQGYSDKQMIEAGLIKEGKNGRDPYVFFRERIMVPVLDRRGRVVAFGGRILPDHLRPPDRSGYTPAKYMNSSETPIFNKSHVLYGALQARQAAADDQILFVVEGYFDVIACHQAGFQGAVAPMGTALTEDQIMLLWKMMTGDLKEPILCFDGDNAGRRAAERACETVLPLLAAGKSVRIAFLPDGEDPDSLIQGGGRNSFQKILDNSIPLIEFLWRTQIAGRSFDTPEARAGLVKSLNEKIARIADRDVQKHYDYLIRQKISQQFFNSGQKRFHNKGFKKPQGSGGIALRSPSGQAMDVQIRILIACVINHPQILGAIEENLAMLRIGNQRLDLLRQHIISYYHEHEEFDSGQFHAYLNGLGFNKELDQILSPATYTHGRFAAPLQKKGDDDEHSAHADILQQWRALYEICESKGFQKEMSNGWKNALHSSNEEEEEKLRQILKEKSSGF